MNPLSLTIRHEFDGISELGDTGKNSKTRFFADLPWRIHARSECSDRTKNEKYLGIYIYCNEEDTNELWSCEHDSTVKIITTFKANSGSWGTFSLIDWDTLLKPEEGFIEDDKIIVEANIHVKNVSGMQKSLSFDFSAPSVGSDVALLIDGKKVHVAKQYLAQHSEVFKAMFFGEFVEKNKDEIELQDINYEEFIEFLYVIYPCNRIITFDSYEFILGLADRFQVKCASNAAESYLIKTNKLTVVKKLTIAEQYRLDLLIQHCVAGFASLTEIKDLWSQLKNLSDATNLAIMDRMMQLIELIPV